MTQTFRLKKGSISFEKDKIIISDNAKTEKYIIVIFSIFSVFSIIFGIYNFERIGDKSYDSTLLIMCILLISSLIVFMISKSTKSQLLTNNVKSIKVKKMFRRKILHIKLKNNRLRQVILVDDTEKLEKYLKTYLDGLISK